MTTMVQLYYNYNGEQTWTKMYKTFDDDDLYLNILKLEGSKIYNHPKSMNEKAKNDKSY